MEPCSVTAIIADAACRKNADINRQFRRYFVRWVMDATEAVLMLILEASCKLHLLRGDVTEVRPVKTGKTAMTRQVPDNDIQL